MNTIAIGVNWTNWTGAPFFDPNLLSKCPAKVIFQNLVLYRSYGNNICHYDNIYIIIYIHDSMIIFHMVICWFSSLPSPNAPRISYEVGTVEEHSPPLRVERSPAGGAFAGVLREEFLVQTKVSRGSREAPWELKGLPYIPAGGIFALTKWAFCWENHHSPQRQLFFMILGSHFRVFFWYRLWIRMYFAFRQKFYEGLTPSLANFILPLRYYMKVVESVSSRACQMLRKLPQAHE